MTEQEFDAAASETATEFVYMLTTAKWPVTGLDDKYLAKAMIANGAAVLAARGMTTDAIAQLRGLANALELDGQKPAGQA